MTDAKTAASSGTDPDDADLSDEQIWNEMTEAETGRDDDPARDEDEVRDGDPDADDDPDADGQDGSGDDDRASDRDQRRSEDESDGEGDIWADATPQQKAAFDKLNHDLRSATGRVRALINARKGTPPAAFKKGEAASQISKEDLDRVREEYGDVVGPLPDIVENLQGQLQAFEQQAANERQAITDHERDTLLSRHPDFYDVIGQNPDTLSRWVQDQPLAIRQAVAENNDGIVDAEAASTVFEQFKAFLEGRDDDQPPEKNPQDRLSSKRRRQKAGARSARSSTPPVTQDVPDDADGQEIWDQLAREERRKARGR